jgi:hypothetical protein
MQAVKEQRAGGSERLVLPLRTVRVWLLYVYTRSQQLPSDCAWPPRASILAVSSAGDKHDSPLRNAQKSLS